MKRLKVRPPNQSQQPNKLLIRFIESQIDIKIYQGTL